MKITDLFFIPAEKLCDFPDHDEKNARHRPDNPASIPVHKIEADEIQTPNFNLMSRRPGIGFQYQEEISDKVKYYNIRSCFTQNGKYVSLPRYYDKKIYSDEERGERLESYEMPDMYKELHQMSIETQQQEGIHKESLAYSRLKFESPKSKL